MITAEELNRDHIYVNHIRKSNRRILTICYMSQVGTFVMQERNRSSKLFRRARSWPYPNWKYRRGYDNENIND